ncbi:STE20-related kinase adapter protein beta isoform X2 [Dendrobates tinctorius]|uniref:STE20-related kinase adapter protein beta isoform X2 n=1 Tax=Dendrobates tinctorius TaxID=92724 RepID=UPI003CC96F3A
MSCLDCSCLRRTPVKSISQSKESNTSIYPHWAGELPQCWIPPVLGGHEISVRYNEAHNYELQQELGKRFNNLTTIYLARHTPTGTPVTVQLTDLDDCSDEHIIFLQKEAVMSSFFRHCNIMVSWKMFTVGTWLWVINPFMAYGSASNLVKTYYPEGMSELLIGNILFETLKGLNYLHQNGYIHRSVKGSHILISEDGLVSLSGLGHLCSMVRRGERAKVAYDFPTFSNAVLPWMSPELLRQMLLQKLKGPPQNPLYGNTFPCEESPMKISRSGVDSGIGESVVAASMTQTMTSDRLRTPSPRTFSAALQNLVEICLQQDPDKRPSAGLLLNHPFFKQVRGQTHESLPSLLPSLAQHWKHSSVGSFPVILKKYPYKTTEERKEWTFH